MLQICYAFMDVCFILPLQMKFESGYIGVALLVGYLRHKILQVCEVNYFQHFICD